MMVAGSLRRRVLTAGALALLAVSAVACGSDESDADSSGSASASSPDEGSAFPVSVEHMHGATEIEEEPQKILTVGFSDQDFLLAFGVAPIAVTDWYGDYEFATWEWAQDELGDAEPVVLNKGQFTGEAAPNYEQIAQLDPDLIVGLYTDMSQEQYETLSDIAPTVAPSGEYPPYGMPWQEATRTMGAIVGQPDKAEELIADVEQQFADAAEAHPEFDGVEAVVAEVFEPGKSFIRSTTDPRTTFMTSLGFVLPDDLAELAGQEDGADISDEQMALLDRDLLVWNVGWEPELRPQIEAKPLYAGLDVVKSGHSVFIEDHLISGALTWGTVLSLPYALEKLVPQLAEALA
jgi:iron complex transport system substrate-binding protein